jgi:L-lactate dehydrogenase complex protein LldG
MGSDAKSIVLRRIRAALAASPAAVPTGSIAIPRDYDRHPLTGFGDVDRFAETVAEYRARVHRISAGSIAATVAELIRTDSVLVVPADIPTSWTSGINHRSDPLTNVELDEAGAVLTGCALGIAATGTIVLDAGVAQGRRALTLIPDHHICVVFTDQIVDTVPQAFAALDPLRPLTFISGPSATSDIELNRVEGVHGPRTLDVLIADREISPE